MTNSDPVADASAEQRPLVLVVDDSPQDRLTAGRLVEEHLGCRVLYAATGREALAVLQQQHAAVVLTDLVLPESDGVELVEAIRRHHPQTPIVLMTGQGNEAAALRALLRGAASYVPKKSLASDLTDTLEQVLTAAQKHRQQRRVQECVTRLEYHFELENDRTLIPVLVHFVQEQLGHLQVCDDAGRIRVGVALEEALLNAIVHGNLEIGSDQRQHGDTAYHQLVEQRRWQRPFCDRRVHFDADLSRQEAIFVVRDEGRGFRPADLPDPTDPANLEKITGRGLLLIQTFMDDIQFNEAGNQITLVKRRAGNSKK